MQSFNHENHAGRVVFGSASLDTLPDVLDSLGIVRALVVTTPEQADLGHRIDRILGQRSVGVLDKAVMHVPVEVAREAIRAARATGADACIAAGGGSTIGLAKAIALESDLPIVALPTTYAGSEMTPLYGLTEAGVKKTGKDWRVLPRCVVYDPELTLSLPVELSVTSGMNAIAHAVEGLYARDGSPVYSLMAEEGIRALADALPRLYASPSDVDARGDALYGAWLCGTVLGNVQMGIHHKICHTLGGTFNLPHAAVHTVILPYALAYNAAYATHALARVGRAIGAADAVAGLRGLGDALDMPRSLREIGMPRDGLDRAADLIVEKPYPNPRPIERQAVRALLERAYEGTDPL
ncbi:maleylacetate reductase [Burkholderia sp. Bp9031]|uniref:maleylacetate reductase n=1 Tax=Burkholderia sp. Bp9031 TaxID=2184566 RepID=UPI000F5DEA2B|nr:maleylacetate reductase [Burkholderia sp. Bp9031]RQZ17218.1 maleylacetate reductase [Burkholderia sp. Bp9031]